MITEIAVLDVRDGQETAFETSFRQTTPIIRSVNGYIEHELLSCIEKNNRYCLIVRKKCLSDHTVGFRQGEQYQDWKRLLHHYHEPFPIVEYYQ